MKTFTDSALAQAMLRFKASLYYIASPCPKREVGVNGDKGEDKGKKNLKTRKRKSFICIGEFGKV